MSDINAEKLLHETNHLINELFPDIIIHKSDFEHRNSYFNLWFFLNDLTAIQITVDLMDSLIVFYIIILEKEDTFKYGYGIDPKGRSIRVYFSEILSYLKIPFEKKEISHLANLKSNFYLNENCNKYLLQKVRDNLLFFAPILKNKQLVFIQLQNLIQP